MVCDFHKLTKIASFAYDRGVWINKVLGYERVYSRDPTVSTVPALAEPAQLETKVSNYKIGCPGSFNSHVCIKVIP